MIGVVLAVIGFAGFDRIVYQWSLHLNTPNPVDYDFYHRTRWLWEACRFPGHLAGGMAAFFLIWAFHPQGWVKANIGLMSVLLTTAFVALLKMGIGRLRPNQAEHHLAFLPPFHGFSPDAAVSCPSGEAAVALGLAAVLARVAPRYFLVFYAIATTTALARLINGAHYFSDVVLGGLVGIAVTTAVFDALESHYPAIARHLPGFDPQALDTPARRSVEAN
jgi:membrane-associated phospholipid phosphatase